MGIFSKIDKSKKKGTTRGFYFGATEAEGENVEGQDLLTYFDDYLKVLPLIKEGRFIFLGRKGVGKSAIAKYIKDSADIEEDSFASLVKMHDLELEKLIQGDAFSDFDNKEAVLFEWLILVQLIKLIIQNESAKWITEYTKLNKFIERNSGIINIDKYQIQEIIRNKNYEVTFEPLRHVFGGIFKNHFGTKKVKAPFHQLIPALREVVQTIIKYDVNKDKEFWLMFDDLDITFQENESKQRMITELLRITKTYNNDVLKGSKSKILVFLRDDIKRKIESSFPDTAKIFSSYEIPINWYDHQTFKLDENVTNLKSFINKRIALNFDSHDISYDTFDPWSTLIPDDSYEYLNKSSFKYLLDFTFYRPRDLILFLSNVGLKDYQFPLQPETVKLLLRKYINANIVEIKNELGLNFTQNEINLLFNQVFSHISNHPHLTKGKLCEYLNGLEFEKDSRDIFILLKEYSLIAFKNPQGKLFFEHRGDRISDEETQTFFITLPKCIYHNYAEIN